MTWHFPFLVLFAGLLAWTYPSSAEPVRFVAFGDMPYCRPEAPDRCPGEEARVARLMQAINAAEPAFSIFLGDTKGGSELCTDEKLLRAFTWMGLARQPLVYTPGDNEWTDCWQDRSGRYDPLDRLRLLRERFFSTSMSFGRAPMPLSRQGAPYVENTLWVRDGIVFLTLHVPGSNNNLPTEPLERPMISPPGSAESEHKERDIANRTWVATGFALGHRIQARAVVVAMQADMFYTEVCRDGYDSGYRAIRDALSLSAREFRRPVLLLNGDTHIFVRDNPLQDTPNLTRVMVPGEGDVRAVQVTLDPEAAEPLTLLLLGAAPEMPVPPPCEQYAPLMEATRSR
jgi:hypothetical protein